MALVGDVLNWLAALPQPALVGATGGLILLECTIGLGFIAPGEAGLLIASTTVSAGPEGFSLARFLVLWVVVTVAAACGDSIGYVIGRRFGPSLRETKLIKKYGAEGWDKTTGILRKRGAWAVFFGRWLPVVRTLMPAAAGTAGLPYRKFLPAAMLGAASWSLAHISIGASLGAAAKQLEHYLSTGGLIVVAALVLVGFVVFTVRKRKKTKAKAALAANETAKTDEVAAAESA
nr:DedA family protein [Kibdelosporangium sp. MJ126-NF4]CEL18794.1 DedA protein [Kibdelosporangium sp. MJ126-NF4]CTQ96353.1 DedA protein [Kibdelosporangium sp. MJ126-NF4]